ncbi:PSME3-interacting protein [Scaptodrosophila lebanonensis]|uniref:PSME3-interacting protein n=1 Tax=Drosophila lebanonensis TaxID=7225 RepID=A0A6J2TF89_DROLE|nr:PSME3-interacting protein [Scaptodrosophila lebanonensis]
MSSGFVTETEAVETRQRRQEEWERVRKPDDPVELPQDSRSLYDRLKEQKTKKDMEYEEAHKLKNLIRGLDDDEVQFLELLDQNKLDAERQQLRDEERELNDFRSRVEKMHEESVDKKIQAELKTTAKSASTQALRATQKTLLQKSLVIKRKNGEVPTTSKVAKTEDTHSGNSTAKPAPVSITTTKYDQGGLKCIAILPGIGSYTESSDSEATTESDDLEHDHCTRMDLCGRQIPKKKQPCNE